ncbi:hypothetical protein AHAS_Ahas19G0149200 [Arachis hypogaea]
MLLDTQAVKTILLEIPSLGRQNVASILIFSQSFGGTLHLTVSGVSKLVSIETSVIVWVLPISSSSLSVITSLEFLLLRLGDKRRKNEEDGVGSSCSSIYLCGSPSSGGCYCHGLALEHTLQRWLSLGSYQQKSDIQCSTCLSFDSSLVEFHLMHSVKLVSCEAALIPLTEFREQEIMKRLLKSVHVLFFDTRNCTCSVQCKQIKEEEVDEQILSSFSHTRVYHGVKNHVTQIRLESLNFKESMRK